MSKPFDHIGWDLWQANAAWKQRFTEAMVHNGHAWFAEARANIFHLIGPEGTKQSDLVVKSKLTKQAVQQFLDELEADGIVIRAIDPADKRGKIVKLTKSGKRVLENADQAKRKIESHYEKLIGKSALASLKQLLSKIANDAKE
jgi:DNA-binding MarR family transcriptional regulator